MCWINELWEVLYTVPQKRIDVFMLLTHILEFPVRHTVSDFRNVFFKYSL